MSAIAWMAEMPPPPVKPIGMVSVKHGIDTGAYRPMIPRPFAHRMTSIDRMCELARVRGRLSCDDVMIMLNLKTRTRINYLLRQAATRPGFALELVQHGNATSAQAPGARRSVMHAVVPRRAVPGMSSGRHLPAVG